MINSYLRSQVIQNFLHTPTENQFFALNKLCDFLLARESDTVFLLTGYAGTGKTTLVSALVKTMKALNQPRVLLAPYGEAAKFFRLRGRTWQIRFIRKFIVRNLLRMKQVVLILRLNA